MICCYLRVSTKDQADRNGAEAQRTDLERWLRARDIDPRKCVWIEDLAISGRKSARPGLARLSEMIEAGECEKVIAADLDRVFRSTRHMIEFVQKCHDRGTSLHFTRSSLEVSDTPMGRLLVAVMSAVAQFESEIGRERTRAGVRNAMQRHAKWGGAKLVDPKKDAAITRHFDRHGASSAAREFGVTRRTVYKAVRRTRGELEPA